MEWKDEAIILNAKKHGENSAIVSIFTREKGRQRALVRGAFSKKNRGILQPGNHVDVVWRGRLEEHLGNFTFELLDAHAAEFLLDAGRLAALSTACTMMEYGFAEGETHKNLYDTFASLGHALAHETWPELYVKWEISLLSELGYGIDLSQCAATGQQDDLIYVSPKSGRAVSRLAGQPYHHKLLKLPAFLVRAAPMGANEFQDAMKLTWYFFDRHMFGLRKLEMPDTRQRLIKSALRILT